MSVPVQTWGAMGNMVGEQKSYGEATSEYLEQHEVYDLFSALMKELVINQPEDPIKFLQEQLTSKQLVPLTVAVLGPPGVQRSRYSKMLADDYKLEYIHVGTLLRTAEHEHAIANGDLVDDSAVIPLVKDAIRRAKKKGYVLDGFPRTRVQAQALAERGSGFGLDNVVLMTASAKVIQEGFEAKIQAGQAPESMENVVRVKLQQYQRHVLGISEVFKSVLRQIPALPPGDDDKGSKAYTNLLHCVPYRSFSNAPSRPHRICVTGPCASGRTTQAREIAKNYGLVHVEIASLIAKQLEERGLAKEEIPPEYVSDVDLCAAVGKRLGEPDCQRKGWVLDGFPITRGQAEFLRQSHLWPSRMFDLNLNVGTVMARIINRKIDPVTNTAYYKEPASVAIRQRLIQADYDGNEAVMARYQMYAESQPVVKHLFDRINFTVRGEDEIPGVTKSIVASIDESLPSEMGQNTA